jgi:hypothetical protein
MDAGRRLGEISAHGHAMGVAVRPKVGPIEVRPREVPAIRALTSGSR